MRDVNGNTGNRNRGNNNTNDDDDDRGFGDTVGPLNNNHLRIGFQNIIGLSSNNTEQDNYYNNLFKAIPLMFLGSAKSTSTGQHYRKSCSLEKE
jgi:hypothetical protein